MCVLPTQAASLDQFWRKMRHWQIKWSSSEAYTAVVKWNKFPKHIRDQLEVIQPDRLNSKRKITLVGILKIRAAIIIKKKFILGVKLYIFYITCSLASHHEAPDDLLIWTQPPNNLHNCFITLSLLPHDELGAKSWKSPSRVSLPLQVHRHISCHI